MSDVTVATIICVVSAVGSGCFAWLAGMASEEAIGVAQDAIAAAERAINAAQEHSAPTQEERS